MNMKSTKWLAAGVAALCVSASACGNLTEQPQSQVTSANIFSDPNS